MCACVFSGKKKVFLKRIFEEEPVAKAEQEKPRPWEQKAVSVGKFLT